MTCAAGLCESGCGFDHWRVIARRLGDEAIHAFHHLREAKGGKSDHRPFEGLTLEPVN